MKATVLYGAKRAGVTYLYEFDSRSQFENAQAAAKRLGLNLAQLLLDREERWQELRKFKEEDAKTSTLKIQITECDEFTKTCLERQAARSRLTVEEYVAKSVYFLLEIDETDAILDPRTGEVVMYSCNLGSYRGCNVDKNAPKPPPPNFTRHPIPAETIVESCA